MRYFISGVCPLPLRPASKLGSSYSISSHKNTLALSQTFLAILLAQCDSDPPFGPADGTVCEEGEPTGQRDFSSRISASLGGMNSSIFWLQNGCSRQIGLLWLHRWCGYHFETHWKELLQVSFQQMRPAKIQFAPAHVAFITLVPRLWLIPVHSHFGGLCPLAKDVRFLVSPIFLWCSFVPSFVRSLLVRLASFLPSFPFTRSPPAPLSPLSNEYICLRQPTELLSDREWESGTLTARPKRGSAVSSRDLSEPVRALLQWAGGGRASE